MISGWRCCSASAGAARLRSTAMTHTHSRPILVLLCALAFAAAASLSSMYLNAQSERAPAAVLEYGNAGELKAKAHDAREFAKARFFDEQGSVPVRPGTSVRIVSGMSPPPVPAGVARPPYTAMLKALLCGHDAVVVGT